APYQQSRSPLILSSLTLTHTHTHTHTHTLTHSLSLAHSLTHTHKHTLSPSLFFSLSPPPTTTLSSALFFYVLSHTHTNVFFPLLICFVLFVCPVTLPFSPSSFSCPLLLLTPQRRGRIRFVVVDIEGASRSALSLSLSLSVSLSLSLSLCVYRSEEHTCALQSHLYRLRR